MKYPIMVVDKKNKNGVVYNRDSVEKAIAKLKLPHYSSTNPNDTGSLSHAVTGMELVGDVVYADIKVLNTPAGESLKALIGTNTGRFVSITSCIPNKDGSYDVDEISTFYTSGEPAFELPPEGREND